MTSKVIAGLQGEAHFFEESMNPMKVKEYLSRPKVRTECFLTRTKFTAKIPSTANMSYPTRGAYMPCEGNIFSTESVRCLECIT